MIAEATTFSGTDVASSYLKKQNKTKKRRKFVTHWNHKSPKHQKLQLRLQSHRSIILYTVFTIRYTICSLQQTTFKWCRAESGLWWRANRIGYSEYRIQYTPMWLQPYGRIATLDYCLWDFKQCTLVNCQIQVAILQQKLFITNMHIPQSPHSEVYTISIYCIHISCWKLNLLNITSPIITLVQLISYRFTHLFLPGYHRCQHLQTLVLI